MSYSVYVLDLHTDKWSEYENTESAYDDLDITPLSLNELEYKGGIIINERYFFCERGVKNKIDREENNNNIIIWEFDYRIEIWKPYNLSALDGVVLTKDLYDRVKNTDYIVKGPLLYTILTPIEVDLPESEYYKIPETEEEKEALYRELNLFPYNEYNDKDKWNELIKSNTQEHLDKFS